MKNLNLLQKNGMLQTVKQQKANTANSKYSQNNSIKFETESIKSSLCDYSDAFILVAENITVNANNNTDVVFKSCAPFSSCKTEIHGVFVDEANHILQCLCIGYSDNYSDISESLWQFKRDKVPANNDDLIIDNSKSFKYKAALVGENSRY